MTKWISIKDKNGEVRHIPLRRDPWGYYNQETGVVYRLKKDGKKWILTKIYGADRNFERERIEGNSISEIKQKAAEKWGIIPEIKKHDESAKGKKRLTAEELYERAHYNAWNVDDDPRAALEAYLDNPVMDDEKEYLSPSEEKKYRKLIQRELDDIDKEFGPAEDEY